MPPGGPSQPWRSTPYGATGQALNSAVKQLAMGGEWLNKRLKAVRFGVVNLPGRMVRHGRRLIIRLPGDHPSYGLLIGMRRSILALAADPEPGPRTLARLSKPTQHSRPGAPCPSRTQRGLEWRQNAVMTHQARLRRLNPTGPDTLHPPFALCIRATRTPYPSPQVRRWILEIPV